MGGETVSHVYATTFKTGVFDPKKGKLGGNEGIKESFS